MSISTPPEVVPFVIQNDHGLEILGDSHLPTSPPCACVVLFHGFKGYKDYGFIPVLAHELCESGAIVHRFNFSTSGMTNNIERFEREDLFALDTWNRQVEDVHCVLRAIRSESIKGQNLPLYIVGHSRGGASAILSAHRGQDEFDLSGVITINAVDQCNRMSHEDQDQMLERGYTMTRSARTDQDLKIESTWIQEQLDSPEDHNVLSAASKIVCPMLVLHGDEDQAVNHESGVAISKACSTRVHTLKGSNHVLNMPNPSTIDPPYSQAFVETKNAITRFISKQSKS